MLLPTTAFRQVILEIVRPNRCHLDLEGQEPQTLQQQGLASRHVPGEVGDGLLDSAEVSQIELQELDSLLSSLLLELLDCSLGFLLGSRSHVDLPAFESNPKR